MWELENSDGLGLASRLKKLEKSNQREFDQVTTNFTTYRKTLMNGASPTEAFTALKFVRNEREGLYAIDQTPLRKGCLALRLYVYPCEVTKKIYVLLIGDKSQQKDDIRKCHQTVRGIKKLAQMAAPELHEKQEQDDQTNERESSK